MNHGNQLKKLLISHGPQSRLKGEKVYIQEELEILPHFFLPFFVVMLEAHEKCDTDLGVLLC